MEGVFLGGSIAAAFLAGTIALFAPCCITVLFPSYLAAAPCATRAGGWCR